MSQSSPGPCPGLWVLLMNMFCSKEWLYSGFSSLFFFLNVAWQMAVGNETFPPNIVLVVYNSAVRADAPGPVNADQLDDS